MEGSIFYGRKGKVSVEEIRAIKDYISGEKSVAQIGSVLAYIINRLGIGFVSII